MTMDVDAYLQRIRYRGPREPTAATLCALQRAHLRAVPFENLDIHLGRPIVLDLEQIFHKVVRAGRGGFCFELNGLLSWLLRQLGYGVRLMGAGVFNDERGSFGSALGHLNLALALGGEAAPRYLVDVGFGDAFDEPLLLRRRQLQPQGQRDFRLDPAPGGCLVLYMRQAGQPWRPKYRLSLQARTLADFEQDCHQTQTSPDSWFTQKRICTRITQQGRVTLTERALVFTRGDRRDEQPIADEQAYDRALRQHFGVQLEGEFLAPLPGR